MVFRRDRISEGLSNPSLHIYKWKQKETEVQRDEGGS